MRDKQRVLSFLSLFTGLSAAGCDRVNPESMLELMGGHFPGLGPASNAEGDDEPGTYCARPFLLGPYISGSVRDKAGDLVAPSRVTARFEGSQEEVECESDFGSFGCVRWDEEPRVGKYQVRVERGGEVTVQDAVIPDSACGLLTAEPIEVNVGPTPMGARCAEDRLPLLATLRVQPGEGVEGMFEVEVIGLPSAARALARTVQPGRNGSLHEDVFLSSEVAERVSLRIMADVSSSWCEEGPNEIAFGTLEVPLVLTPADDPCRYQVLSPALGRENLIGCGPSGDRAPLDL